MAQYVVKAVCPPDGEHVGGVASTYVDDVIGENEGSQIGNGPIEETKM